MGMTVKADLIEESAIREVGGTNPSYEQDRVYLVSCIGGNASSIHNIALAANGIPPIGAAHPNAPFAFVRRRTTKPVDHNSVKVIVTYVWESVGPNGFLLKLEVGSKTIDVQTSFDKDGHKLEVGFVRKTKDQKTGKISKVQCYTMCSIVTKRLAVSTIGAESIESISPGTISRKYVGKVNKNSWQGGGPGTWYCEQIMGTPIVYINNKPKLWRVEYSFMYNPLSWLQPIVWLDEHGKVAGGRGGVPDLKYPLTKKANDNTGTAVYEMYNSEDFSPFNWGT